jgi:N-acetylmuramoyl-L-alanine amidase
MCKFWKVSWALGLYLLSGLVFAQQNQIDSLRFRSSPDYTRLVFDVSSTPAHKIFVLENPHRVVIDFANARLKRPLSQPPKTHPLFYRIRSAPRNKTDLRVVFDLKHKATPKSFALKPNKIYGNRLVVDLFEKHKPATSSPKKVIVRRTTNSVRDIVIAIDAGHGGEDPGAHGPRGTLEKKVVLSIANKLAVLIERLPGMKPVMVRKGDYYIGLRKRMQIARKAKADLFVSIHSDAFKSAKVKGASVFTLSRSGASSEAARWLVKNENAADLVGGVSLNDKDNLLAAVLLDLSQSKTEEVSLAVAKKVLRNFRRIGELHSKSVQKAGFMVLKSPDIPSILVETGFISNPSEERKLRSRQHQQKIAQAIFNGIRIYFQQHPPAGTRMASTRHTIVRGDTLSAIALRYGVSLEQLRAVNALGSNQVHVGQVLSIPDA